MSRGAKESKSSPLFKLLLGAIMNVAREVNEVKLRLNSTEIQLVGVHATDLL